MLLFVNLENSLDLTYDVLKLVDGLARIRTGYVWI